MSRPRVGSLFTGIAGIDLAFVRAGFDIAFQVENDDFCQAVIKKHAPTYWPNALPLGDIRDVHATDLPPIDVLVGGFPCQDVSSAGKQAGIVEGNRSGLWFEFARLIGELRPRIVFIENVPAITANGGTTVLNSLAALRYDAEWGIVSAADAGAPHLRERWFCVAYANGCGCEAREIVGGLSGIRGAVADAQSGRTLSVQQSGQLCGIVESGNALADANISRQQEQRIADKKFSVSDTTQCSSSSVAVGVGHRRMGSSARNTTYYAQWNDQTHQRFGRTIVHALIASCQDVGVELVNADMPQCCERPQIGGYATHGVAGFPGERLPEPILGRVAHELSAELDRSRGIEEYATSTKSRSDQILRAMRRAAYQKSLRRKRNAGRYDTLFGETILQSSMRRTCRNAQRTIRGGAPKTICQTARRSLRALRYSGKDRNSSQRRQSGKQRFIQPHDLVRIMSHKMALGEWEAIAENTIGLLNLWKTVKGIRAVPKALSSLQKAWRSLADYEKEWCAIRACQSGRLIWPAGFGQPQHEWEPPRTVAPKSMPNRANRLKALGNSVVPQVIYPFAVLIREYLEALQ